jgi:hypothetical protein
VGREEYLFLAVCAAAIVLAAAYAGGLAYKAEARANFTSYLTKGPGGFYPATYDKPGPMNLSIQTMGWNMTRLAGNLGIGNGSVRTFDRTSTYDVEYPDTEFMCGEVSAQPWIPGLKTEAPQAEAAAEEKETGASAEETMSEHGVPAEKATDAGSSDSGNRYALQAIDLNATGGTDAKAGNSTGEGIFNERGRAATNATNSAGATNKTAPGNIEQLRAAAEGPEYDAYHPIQYLRPVKDLLYEHPLSTSGCAYCELLGFETPAGDLVNVGFKTTGYGY